MRSGINNVMMASLSLQLAQWNWNTCADTRYFMWDGKMKQKILLKKNNNIIVIK